MGCCPVLDSHGIYVVKGVRFRVDPHFQLPTFYVRRLQVKDYHTTRFGQVCTS